MSTADRDAAGSPDPTSVATRLREAEFVRIVARRDGDGVAAAGVLARALSSLGTPFQTATAPTVEARTDRVADAADHATEGDETVVVGGAATGDAVVLGGATDDPGTASASVAAWRVADELVADPAPELALAGAFAAGVVPGDGDTAPVLEAADLDRRPGVGLPTDDVVDGLAHSTLFHAPCSGDPERVRGTLESAGVDPGDGRAVASLVALEAAGHEDAPPRSSRELQRALRPHVSGESFATVEGFADVLEAVAREAPGTAVALALGRDVREAALSCWRDRSARIHSAVRAANTGRYDGLLAARVDVEDVPVRAVARLLWAYRSPEPVVLAVSKDAAGAVGGPGGESTPAVGRAIRSAAGAVDGRADGTPDRGYARFDGDPTAFIAAFREAIR